MEQVAGQQQQKHAQAHIYYKNLSTFKLKHTVINAYVDQIRL